LRGLFYFCPPANFYPRKFENKLYLGHHIPTAIVGLSPIIMGNLKKKRRLKMNKHKRSKRSKANRHKKRLWGA
jgi:hypothetical protein